MVGTLTAIAVVGGGIVALVVSFLYGWHCTSGDGGAPYVAVSSPQEGVCDATIDGLVFVILFLAVLVGGAVLTWRTGKPWTTRRGSLLPSVLVAIALPLTPLITVWAADLPSDDCSTEQEAANQEWEDEGARGDPPYQCETY